MARRDGKGPKPSRHKPKALRTEHGACDLEGCGWARAPRSRARLGGVGLEEGTVSRGMQICVLQTHARPRRPAPRRAGPDTVPGRPYPALAPCTLASCSPGGRAALCSKRVPGGTRLLACTAVMGPGPSFNGRKLTRIGRQSSWAALGYTGLRWAGLHWSRRQRGPRPHGCERVRADCTVPGTGAKMAVAASFRPFRLASRVAARYSSKAHPLANF